MTADTWQDGVEELSIIIDSPNFLGWLDEPANMAREWARKPNQMVMSMLESGAGANGPVLDFYKDPDTQTAGTRQLFATDHPFNVLDVAVGTFDNTATTTLAEIRSGAFFSAMNLKFRGVKGPNGQRLGLRLAGGNFLVTGKHENTFKQVLESDTLIRAISNAGAADATSNVVAVTQSKNIYQGNGTGYTVTDESTQDDVLYVMAAGKPGLYPWVVQQGASVEEIICDKTSQKYKDTLKESISEIGYANAAACLPHGIIKVTITG
jgi:hypothetical protein